IIAFVLLVQTNRFHKASFISSTNAMSGGVYSTYSNVTEYLELKRVNQEVAQENADLKSTSSLAFIKMRGKHVYINDTLYFQQYKYLSAKVVNNSVHKRNNHIILNKGSEQGIRSGMGVICSKGLVGIVKDVSSNYSAVVSLLNSKTQISVKLKKNNYFGIMTWESEDNSTSATLNKIPNHVDIQKGDTIISMGASTIFPEGILAGTVHSFEEIPGSDFYTIKVNLSTNFNNLSYVYIIKNLLKTEQQELEEKIEKGDD
ncbi:MAG: rod shape-determining protein MreC, partial [Flavobacteriales bacterium]|nr:rod shape-determining protein MreC [Flavobacteriales bacterium]